MRTAMNSMSEIFIAVAMKITVIWGVMLELFCPENVSAGSSERMVTFYWTTQCQTPQESNLLQ
jgi:hypothetical protein